MTKETTFNANNCTEKPRRYMHSIIQNDVVWFSMIILRGLGENTLVQAVIMSHLVIYVYKSSDFSA